MAILRAWDDSINDYIDVSVDPEGRIEINQAIVTNPEYTGTTAELADNASETITIDARGYRKCRVYAVGSEAAKNIAMQLNGNIAYTSSHFISLHAEYNSANSLDTGTTLVDLACGKLQIVLTNKSGDATAQTISYEAILIP